LSAAINLGSLIATFSNYFLKQFSPHLVLKICKFTFAVGCLLALISNPYVLIAVRFLQGFTQGLMVTNAIFGLYQVGYKTHRSRLPTLLNVYFGINYFVTYFLGVLDDNTRVYWRVFYIIQFCIVAIELSSMLTVLKGTDAISYVLKTKGKGAAISVLSRVLSSKYSTESVSHMIEMQQLEEKKNKDRSQHMIKFYSKEFIFAILIGTILASSLFAVFLPFSLLWITKDINNTDEVRVAKYFTLSYAIVEFIAKVLCTALDLHKYRKPYFMFGLFIQIIGWSMISCAYFLDV